MGKSKLQFSLNCGLCFWIFFWVLKIWFEMCDFNLILKIYDLIWLVQITNCSLFTHFPTLVKQEVYFVWFPLSFNVFVKLMREQQLTNTEQWCLHYCSTKQKLATRPILFFNDLRFHLRFAKLWFLRFGLGICILLLNNMRFEFVIWCDLPITAGL